MTAPAPRTDLAAERAEFERQVRKMLPVVRGMLAGALGVGHEHPDVDDALNEVFKRAWEGRSRLQDGMELRPWVFGISRHVALDMLRVRGRERGRMTSGRAAHRDDEQHDSIEGVADDAPGAEELLGRHEMRARVRAAMEQLPSGVREAMLLAHVEGLKYQQISKRLGVPLGTVATWISRGRRTVIAAVRGQL